MTVPVAVIIVIFVCWLTVLGVVTIVMVGLVVN